MNQIDEAIKVMSQMINRAIDLARERNILGTSKMSNEIMQELMTEAFSKIPCSFNSRAELSMWHQKAIDRSKKEIETKINSWKVRKQP